MILGIATEKHRRNRRHFQDNLSLSSMELPLSRSDKQQSATAWKMSLDISPVYTEKEKKTIHRFISTFMPFFYILTVLF